MKKVLIILTVLIFAALFVSCDRADDVCVYAYFNNTAFLLIFNNSNNTVYRIELPLDLIVNYGKLRNLTTVPQAMEDFTGLKADILVAGTQDSYKSLRRILDCWADNRTSEDYLKTMVIHAQDLSKQPLLSKINRLCSSDVSTFIEHLKTPELDTVCIDCGSFLGLEDPMQSRSYFRKWIRQLLGD